MLIPLWSIRIFYPCYLYCSRHINQQGQLKVYPSISHFGALWPSCSLGQYLSPPFHSIHSSPILNALGPCQNNVPIFYLYLILLTSTKKGTHLKSECFLFPPCNLIVVPNDLYSLIVFLSSNSRIRIVFFSPPACALIQIFIV